MSDVMKQFLEEMMKNPALQERLQNSKSPEEAYAVASEKVAGLDFGEFTTVMIQLKELAIKVQSEELTDEDLQMVAGGWTQDDTHYTLYAVIGVMGVGTVIPLAMMAAI